MIHSTDWKMIPRMGRFMRQMSHEMGEDMGDELEEVAGRLEKGESMESIERSLPELADSGGLVMTLLSAVRKRSIIQLQADPNSPRQSALCLQPPPQPDDRRQ